MDRLTPRDARGLAEIDPALRHLPDVLEAASAAAWRLHDVRWSPGSGCRMAFEVDGPPGATEFVGVEANRDGWTKLGHRDDPQLPWVGEASDPAAVLRRLGADPATARCRVTTIRYRPRSRAVMRYEIESPSGRTRLYAKAFSRSAFAGASELARTLGTSENGLVPETVAVWPDLCVTLGRAVEGRSASDVLGDPTVAPAARVRLGHRIGHLLARFHAERAVEVPSYSPEDHLVALQEPLAAAECADPRLGARLRALADLLARSAPSGERPVLAHGSFRCGQVVVAPDGRLVVLDIDRVARASGARDVGNALAYLAWQSIRQPAERPTMIAAERAMVAGYERNWDGLDRQALAWWRAAAMLRLAGRRYRRLEISAWGLVPILVDATEELLRVRGRRTSRGRGGDLADPGYATSVIRPALAGIAAEPGAVEVVSAEPMAAHSTRRRVIEYRVAGLDATAIVPLVGKVFADARHAALLHANLCLLSNGPFATAPSSVPRPIGLVRDERLVLYRPCDGVPLTSVVSDVDLAAGIRHAAIWLGRLHAADVRLPRLLQLDREETTTRRWATRIGDAQPGLASQARRLADGWVAAVRRAPTDTVGPLHKDFHPGHVLLADGRVSVIDFDEAREGDPAFDLAHFCAHLELAAPVRPTDVSLERLFLGEYIKATGWSDAGSFGGYSAYAWLKIAKQAAVGSGPMRGRGQADREDVTEQALARGERWLGA